MKGRELGSTVDVPSESFRRKNLKKNTIVLKELSVFLSVLIFTNVSKSI